MVLTRSNLTECFNSMDGFIPSFAGCVGVLGRIVAKTRVLMSSWIRETAGVVGRSADMGRRAVEGSVSIFPLTRTIVAAATTNAGAGILAHMRYKVW
ncbi:hypothetical protein EJ110_NYTH33176 [Nymphaea thermarum]|nr:hypothetical protein EJ110_NYTH33176 [Nymphaea thermarum]